jgi:hypothetical protein
MPRPLGAPTVQGGSLGGELQLIAAILAQARKDVHSPRAEVRQEAEAFWRDAESVAWWAELLDMDVTVLQRAGQG